jgi:predicted XRE-type DNA-binding protein
MLYQPECYEGSGNVFADIGLKNADKLYARACIGIEVPRILNSRKLKQREIGELLDIRQSKVSHLMNGHFSRFSEGKLLGFLKKLDRADYPARSTPRYIANVVNWKKYEKGTF